MTTVGYGNQSPETMEGRILVGCLAWISIIIWMVLLFVAGQGVGIIMDDFFRKCNLKFMTGDIAGAFFWGLMGFLWILVLASFAVAYWGEINNFQDTLSDGLWFAYISLLTVGECVLIVSTVIHWSVLY